MKLYFVGMFTVVTLFFCSVTKSEAVSSSNIQCLAIGSDAKLTSSLPKTKPIVIKSRSDICEAGYEFTPYEQDMIDGFISTPPIELGLHAVNNIYSVSFLDGKSELVGQLPVSSEKISNHIYEDFLQEGGSIYRKEYKITKTAVLIEPIQLELLVNGTLCKDDPLNVWQTELNTASKCLKTTIAKPSKPLCIIHENDKAKLTKRGACHKLELFFSNK